LPSHPFIALKKSDLKSLPFEAIKVKLFGNKQLKPIDFDVICDLTRNQNQENLMVFAQKQKFENGIKMTLNDNFFVLIQY
jgi:transposase